MSEIKLRPMSEAPKDREIFAVMLRTDHYGLPIKGQIDAGNFHPIQWKDYKWIDGFVPHWGMRWSEDFRTTLADYGGWIDPKDLPSAVGKPPGRPL
jgi:hypothetical protein